MVERAHRNREFRDVHGVGDAQPALPHVLDMLRPGIDERDVLTRLHHMGAGIAADGARSDDRDFSAHGFSPHFLGGKRPTASAHPLRDSLADRAALPTSGRSQEVSF
jgi:hypothetical protein